MGSRITGIGTYVPEQYVDNFALAKEIEGFQPLRVEQKLGIKGRHIAKSNETVLDLATQAALALFKKNPDAAAQVDFILFCTQSPDYKLPTTACLLQKNLNLPDNIGAIDFNLGCSGFVYGLALAHGLCNANIARNILLITSETYSHYLASNDKGCRAIFGDGAAATLIQATEEECIGVFSLGTDGGGAANLIVQKGGSKEPSGESQLFMDGPAIFNFALQRVPDLVKEVLEKNNETLDSIDHFVFHQANQYMLSCLRTTIGIPAEKFHIDMSFTGNTVSASIPILLESLVAQGKIKKGEKVLLAGFGVGYSWGGTVVQF